MYELKKGTDRSVHANDYQTNEKFSIGDRLVRPFFDKILASCHV